MTHVVEKLTAWAEPKDLNTMEKMERSLRQARELGEVERWCRNRYPDDVDSDQWAKCVGPATWLVFPRYEGALLSRVGRWPLGWNYVSFQFSDDEIKEAVRHFRKGHSKWSDAPACDFEWELRLDAESIDAGDTWDINLRVCFRASKLSRWYDAAFRKSQIAAVAERIVSHNVRGVE